MIRTGTKIRIKKGKLQGLIGIVRRKDRELLKVELDGEPDFTPWVWIRREDVERLPRS